jgi:hypothetical protein
MKIETIAEVAVIAMAAFLTFSSTVSAESTSKECWTLANTVKARLDANPNASADAVQHYRTGADACARGFNSFGVTHLEAAMKALGG